MNRYHLELQANPQKIGQKNLMLWLPSIGETGLSHDIFLTLSAGKKLFMTIMAIPVVEFLNGGYKIKKIFA